MTTLELKIVGFDYLKDNYKGDEDLGGIWEKCKQAIDGLHIYEGFAFCEPLCVRRLSGIYMVED